MEHLSKLQDEMPPNDVEEVMATVEAELGRSCSELFLYFDPVPLGTASIAQVRLSACESASPRD